MAFHLTWKPNLYFQNITFLHGESMVWGYSECEESKQEATTLAQVPDGCVLKLGGSNEDRTKELVKDILEVKQTRLIDMLTLAISGLGN